MKPPDKFLMGITIGVIVLVAVVFAVVLSRPAVEYKPGDSPEGIAFNYLLAIQNEDYERAYSYLSTHLQDYPKTAAEFMRDIENDRWRFRSGSSVSLDITSFDMLGDGEAVVSVRETWFNSGDLFSSSQSRKEFNIYLEREDGEWKIVDADYYFSACWTSINNCNYPVLPPIP